MKIGNNTDQRWSITARVPGKEKGSDIEIPIDLHRVPARKAWEAASPAERADMGEEPVIERDLTAIAKDHGVSEDALRAALQRHAVVRAALADGRLRLV